MYQFIPEITVKHLGGYQALDQFKTILPKNISLTCDSSFGLKNWMEFNKHIPLTFAMNGNQGGGLWKLFSKDLRNNQYRTFSNGIILLTIYKGEGLMKIASTTLTIEEVNTTMRNPFQSRETNIQPPTMQLSDETIEILKEFPKEDLIKLVKTLGKSHIKFIYNQNNLFRWL